MDCAIKVLLLLTGDFNTPSNDVNLRGFKARYVLNFLEASNANQFSYINNVNNHELDLVISNVDNCNISEFDKVFDNIYVHNPDLLVELK